MVPQDLPAGAVAMEMEAGGSFILADGHFFGSSLCLPHWMNWFGLEGVFPAQSWGVNHT